RCFPIGNREDAVHTGRGDEGGVRLLVVPGIAISPPAIAVEMEDLRFEPAATARVATLHLEGKGLGQHTVLGKENLAAVEGLGNGDRAVVPLGGGSARQGNESFDGRVVSPLSSVNGKGDHARCRFVVVHRGKKARFAQLTREGSAGVPNLVVRCELIDSSRL